MKKLAADIIILHMHQKPQLYEIRFLGYGVRGTEFFVILCYFCPFTPPPLPNNLENQNFEKIKKALGDAALAIRKKVRQQVFAFDICQFEGISTAKM